MLGRAREEREYSSHRQNSNTANIKTKSNSPGFLENYAYGYNPYATVHLKRLHEPLKTREASQRHRPNEIITLPFKRISRVEHMIHQQKKQIQGDQMNQAFEQTAYSYSLRPQFKVKTNKNLSVKNYTKEGSFEHSQNKLHLQNISLECTGRANTSLPPEDKANNNFQEIFKNRKKLNRKSPHKKLEVSLLEMLNRITEGTPIHRYKSKAFDRANKVNSFFHNS